MRLFEDILDDLEARSKSASKYVSDNIETEGYSSINEWYDDVEQNYTHIFRLMDFYIMVDKEETIDNVVYQLERIADRYFPNHSDVLIRTDSEEDGRNIRRKNFFWSGKNLNNRLTDLAPHLQIINTHELLFLTSSLNTKSSNSPKTRNTI